MNEDLATAVGRLTRLVRDGRAAILMDLDGVPVEQAVGVPDAEPEALAGEYAGPLRQVLALARELDLGRMRTYSVRARDRQVVFGFVGEDLFLGVEAGPGGLLGPIRYHVAQSVGRLGEP